MSKGVSYCSFAWWWMFASPLLTTKRSKALNMPPLLVIRLKWWMVSTVYTGMLLKSNRMKGCHTVVSNWEVSGQSLLVMHHWSWLMHRKISSKYRTKAVKCRWRNLAIMDPRLNSHPIHYRSVVATFILPIVSLAVSTGLGLYSRTSI